MGKRKAKAIGAFVSRKLADARRPLIDAVRDIAGDVKLSDDVDIATAMQLAPGRIMVEHQKIDADYINPVIEILVANNVAVEQLDTYLTAMYALHSLIFSTSK